MTARELAALIEARLARDAGLDLMVEDDGETLVVTGEVGTDDERQRALELTSQLAGGRHIEDDIEVTEIVPGIVGGLRLAETDTELLPGGDEGYEERTLEPGDFQSQPVLTDSWSPSGPTSAIDDDVVSEGDLVFSPPTDPVATNREVIGGLQASSMDSIEVARSALDGRLGDEAIADAVRRELREDAATTDLAVDVEVLNGIVRLRGNVQYLFDAENAEEVAARVPGVVEVLEELDVESVQEA